MPIRNTEVRNPDQPQQGNAVAFAHVGAVVSVEIHIPQAIAQVLAEQNRPIPPAVSGLAMVDTGATRTCVHEPSLTSLGLNPISIVNSGTAGGVVQHNVYPARIVFPAWGWDLNFAGLTSVNLTGQLRAPI